MKPFFAFFFLLSSHCFGAECFDKAINLLNSGVEKEIVLNYQKLVEQYLDCDVSNYQMFVALHEGVHMSDVNLPIGMTQEELEEWYRSHPIPPEFSLLSLDGTRLGKIRLKSPPSPRDIMRPFLDKNYPEVMANPGHPIHDELQGYIDDEDMLSSKSFALGHTELNAYTHGTAFELRTETNVERILYGQLLGVWFQLLTTKIFLADLKEKFPDEWKLMMEEHNRKIISQLVSNIAKVLAKRTHCPYMGNNSNSQMFNLVADEKFLAPLREVLYEPEKLDFIFCR